LRFLLISSLVFGEIMFALSEFISIKIFNKPSLIPFLKAFSLIVPITVLTGPTTNLLLSYGKGDW